MRAAAPLVAVLLLLPLAPAGAKETLLHAQWEYRISIPEPTSGNVHVVLTLRGMQDGVTRFVFATKDHRDPVTNVTGGPATPLVDEPSGVAFTVDGVEVLSYDVRVERPAFTPGQLLSHAGSDFALFKSESVALEYRYSFFEGTTFDNRTRVILEPPAGWQAAGPWKRTAAANEYELPPGQVLPRGYVAFGKFLATLDKDTGGKTVHYVRLGKAGDFERDMYSYIDKATPYYAAVYGPGVERDVLVVNAPDPMFRGGLGGANSFFIHESADLRTVAHEYAHVFQQFGSQELVGSSAIWLNEGDADYHSALSLFAAELWTPREVNEFFDDAAAAAKDPNVKDLRLPDATYGSTSERFAYQKGFVVLRALDVLMHEKSGGQVSLSDLLRRLNGVHGDPSRPEAAEPVENDEVQREAEAILGFKLTDFFDAYVHGTQWPVPVAPFVPEGMLVVEDLRLEPASAPPGSPVAARVNVTNRGTNEASRIVDLMLDGKVAASTTLALKVGASQVVTFHLVAPAEPGDHEARVLYQRATLHSQTPANLTIARSTLVPATPRAGVPLNLLVHVENVGEQDGTGRIEARADGRLLARTTETIVAGMATEIVTIPLLPDRVGSTNLTLLLASPTGDSTVVVALEVQPPDTDGDGVADPDDAYPDNADLWRKSVGNDIKDTPVPLWAALVALGALALFRRRR